MYGPGDFGCVTVLSTDPKSGFSIWEATSRLENRECNFIGVVEVDSNYYGFLIEQGVCSNDIWTKVALAGRFIRKWLLWKACTRQGSNLRPYDPKS
jgi:hypothetical protein